MIEHDHPECTGYWTLLRGVLVCSGCERTHAATPAARMAATDENYLARLLTRATEAGARFVRSDPRR
jgi:hypothetical protein